MSGLDETQFRASEIEVGTPPSGASGQPWTVHQGDARNTGTFLAQFAADNLPDLAPFLTATITSPPYANLVDYGSDNQIGFGQSLDEYLDECERIFADIYRWTKPDGALWVVADTLMKKRGRGELSTLIPLPFALASRAEKAGWTLREVVIWRKDRTRPWAHPGRLRNGFEYVLFFARGASYKHRVERLRDLRSLKSWWVKYPERHNPWGMTPDNVWEIPIPVQGSWASSALRHACPFPEELVRRIVQLSTDEGDVVFDPFAGSGMVAAVAEADGRLALGTELNPEFKAIYDRVIRPAVVTPRTFDLDVDSDDITGKLLTLRVLKYAKVLVRLLLRGGFDHRKIAAAFVDAEPFDMSPRTTRYGEVRCVIYLADSVSDEDLADVRRRIERAETRAPLSRYGLVVETGVRRVSESLTELTGQQTMFAYIEGRTWDSAYSIPPEQVDAWLSSNASHKIPPVISTMEVHQNLEE